MEFLEKINQVVFDNKKEIEQLLDDIEEEIQNSNVLYKGDLL